MKTGGYIKQDAIGGVHRGEFVLPTTDEKAVRMIVEQGTTALRVAMLAHMLGEIREIAKKVKP